MAFSKIAGFEVTPRKPSSSIRRRNFAAVIKLRRI